MITFLVESRSEILQEIRSFFFFPFLFDADEKLLLTWGSLASVGKGLCMSCKIAKEMWATCFSETVPLPPGVLG